VPCAADAPRAIAERPVQLRGSAVARALLRLAGWRVAFDGLPSRREVALVDFLQLCGDPETDLAAIAARLGHHRGRRPEWAAPIRLKD
jgi:pterin-4a-carbinolamine dehydratase